MAKKKIVMIIPHAKDDWNSNGPSAAQSPLQLKWASSNQAHVGSPE